MNQLLNNVYLGLGSNLGNREQNIERAIQLLNESEEITVVKVSPFIETEAESSYSQPKFINAAALITTILTPQECLDRTQAIEIQLGRQEKGKYAPRPIDLDILLFDNQIISTSTLSIPHPFMHERNFVLEPLQSIAPAVEHPIFQDTIQELYTQLKGY